MRKALAGNPLIAQMSGGQNGGFYTNPKLASIQRAVDLIPDAGPVKVKHVLHVMAVAERMRNPQWESAANGAIFEPGWRQLTAANYGLNTPEAFVRPETLAPVVERLGNILIETF